MLKRTIKSKIIKKENFSETFLYNIYGNETYYENSEKESRITSYDDKERVCNVRSLIGKERIVIDNFVYDEYSTLLSYHKNIFLGRNIETTVVSFEYDSENRVISKIDKSNKCEERYIYSPSGFLRLTRYVKNGALEKSKRIIRDEFNNIISEFEYDNKNVLINVKNYQRNYCKKDNRIIGITENGFMSNYKYNKNGDIKVIINNNDVILGKYEYTYYPSKNNSLSSNVL